MTTRTPAWEHFYKVSIESGMDPESASAKADNLETLWQEHTLMVSETECQLVVVPETSSKPKHPRQPQKPKSN